MYFLLHYHHWRLGQESCLYNNQFTMSLWQTSIRTHVSSLVLSSPSPPSLPPPHSLPLPLPLHRCQGSPAIVSGENCPKSAISKMVYVLFLSTERRSEYHSVGQNFEMPTYTHTNMVRLYGKHVSMDTCTWV